MRSIRRRRWPWRSSQQPFSPSRPTFPEEPSGTSDDDRTLTFGMTADIPGLSPSMQHTYHDWFADTIWCNLLSCDEFAKLSAQLAEEWEFNEDQSAVTLKVHKGVKFSDGSDVDFTDVEVTPTAVGKVNARLEGLTFDTLDANTITFRNLDYWDSELCPDGDPVGRVFTNETAASNALKTEQINGTLVSAVTKGEAKKFSRTSSRCAAIRHNCFSQLATARSSSTSSSCSSAATASRSSFGGWIVELGEARQVATSSRTPRARSLQMAAPVADPVR